MSDAEPVRWMVTFYHSEGGAHNEPDFRKLISGFPTKKPL